MFWQAQGRSKSASLEGSSDAADRMIYVYTTIEMCSSSPRLWVAHRDCVRSVVSFIQQQKLEDAILAGHSFGGSVIQKVAEEIPRLIERTVFLDALIVDDGHCVFDELPAEYVAICNDLARESSDNIMLIPWEVWRDNFIQDAAEPGLGRGGSSCPRNLIR
jgi:pimeloyl-ACP methyl ester carboxylesterase